MSTRRIESALEAAIRASPAGRRIDARRAVRVAEFASVGAVGAALDLALTFALLAHVHYLLANAAGFLLAVSFNFGGNWWLTFDRPDGSIPWQYGSYVGLHVSTFAARAVAVTLLIEATPAPATVATVIGVGVAATANFLGTERIFGGDGRYWLDAVEAVNQLAHAVYTSRLRATLRALGLYTPAYRAYQFIIGLLYRASTHELAVGNATATLYTERPAEVVSVFHTLEKEHGVLERFCSELQPDDRVWDVGANLGVFTALAADRTPDGHVVAFEPVQTTAERCRENLTLSGVADRATVRAVALGAQDCDVRLAVERDEVGTQTPRVSPDGRVTVPQRRGDTGDDLPRPTVLKVDVEGGEVGVLRGLGDRLDGVRLAYVETHDGDVHDSDADAVRELLSSHGFDIEAIHAGEQTYLRGVVP